MVERKQSERDASNYEEFVDRRKTAHGPEGTASATEVGSARTDAAQIQRSAHIRVVSASNAEGPLDTSNRSRALPSGVETRVAFVENYLDLKTCTQSFACDFVLLWRAFSQTGCPLRVCRQDDGCGCAQGCL